MYAQWHLIGFWTGVLWKSFMLNFCKNCKRAFFCILFLFNIALSFRFLTAPSTPKLLKIYIRTQHPGRCPLKQLILATDILSLFPTYFKVNFFITHFFKARSVFLEDVKMTINLIQRLAAIDYSFLHTFHFILGKWKHFVNILLKATHKLCPQSWLNLWSGFTWEKVKAAEMLESFKRCIFDW